MARRARIFRPMDCRGTTAVEFALVGPVFLLLVVGMIGACLVFFSFASMQYAVEEGARCASVKTAICTDNPSTVTYTRAAYFGALSTPTFQSAAAACGHSVSGSATFSIDLIFRSLSIPLTATACYP